MQDSDTNHLSNEKFYESLQKRLFVECDKLDPEFEKAMAEEGITEDMSQWPKWNTE